MERNWSWRAFRSVFASDMPLPERRTSHLAHNRVSIPGARYFVTCCTQGRVPGLTLGMTPKRLVAATEAMAAGGDVSLICFTIMPDHVHWIFVLGERLSLSQVVAKWKVSTAGAVAANGTKWQGNYFEHRLRLEDRVESYALYVFMNPYVADVCSKDEAWPWWRTGAGVSFRFEAGLSAEGVPPPEWSGQPEAGGAGLMVGE